MVWIGGGLFILMGTAALGSIMISQESRGTVTITDQGVLRQVGKWSRLLEWNEIEGFVPMPHGGVTLVPHESNHTMQIPRSLDDYRSCIAELKSRNLESLPASRLQRKFNWKQHFLIVLGGAALCMAYEARHHHAAGRYGFVEMLPIIGGFWMGSLFWSLIRQELEKSSWLRWINRLLLVGVTVWLVHHVLHIW